MKPQNNGLVELHDAKIDSKVFFFCMGYVVKLKGLLKPL